MDSKLWDLIRSLDGFRQMWISMVSSSGRAIYRSSWTSVDPAHREVLKLSRAWIGGWFPFGLLLDRRYRLCWDALCSSSGLQIDNNMSFL
ncbi:uncharacterized protein OCT59_001054 [Rhizophagus irregularis]|uniref:uncharacterized protein n=1 Tax=Rhizophagus irregularis TaxID=588596 RepID=UPI003330BD19|nr:hypothetical protein OCT59_001054 [Rhizophagus irregularis]